MYARKRNGVLAVVIANTLSKSAAILGIKKSHLKELFQNVLDMPALLLWWKWELHSLKLIMASVKCTLAKRKKIMLNSIKSKGQHCADLLASRRNLCFSGLDSGIEEFSNIPSSPSSPFWRSFARFGAITRILTVVQSQALLPTCNLDRDIPVSQGGRLDKDSRYGGQTSTRAKLSATAGVTLEGSRGKVGKLCLGEMK